MRDLTLSVAGIGEVSVPVGTMVADLLHRLGFSECGRPCTEDVLAIKVNDHLIDTHSELLEGGTAELVHCGSQEALEVIRHSAAHIMAQAVTELFPGTKLGVGPAIRDGFYYDFDTARTITEEEFARIDERMREIVKEDKPFRRTKLSREEAVRLFSEREERFKLELLRDIPEGEDITVYQTGDQDGDFVDLCSGPHVPSAHYVSTFRLLSVAGTYWRGREGNPVLQRIYGTAFCSTSELEEHLEKLQELKQRDHRVLNRQLDLYSMHGEVGPGLVHWHPQGAAVRAAIENFWCEEHRRRGYHLVYTPHIASERVYQISGHLESYAEEMYAPLDVDGHPYRLKPMNCPGHIMIYKSKLWSYRELPVRYAELGTVYRYERSGVLHGLLRVRGFTQDDGHIFCTPDQLTDEVAKVLDLVSYMMGVFDYRISAYLATRPEKAIGSARVWEEATNALQEAMRLRSWEYEIDRGGGVFYGPKIDVRLEDALGREWQGPTIQVDFNLPERFDATYVGADNAKHRVVMVHRAILGSLERFIGGLLEHYGGAFPVWLAPVQVAVLSVSEKSEGYASSVAGQLEEKDLRVQTDVSSETVGKKVRAAELRKIPYVIVVGPREEQSQTLAVRRRGRGGVDTMSLNDFLNQLQHEIGMEMRGEPGLVAVRAAPVLSGPTPKAVGRGTVEEPGAASVEPPQGGGG